MLGGLQTPSSELSAMGKGRGFGVGPSQWHRPQLRGEWGISNELLLLCRNYVLKKTEVFWGLKKGIIIIKNPLGNPLLQWAYSTQTATHSVWTQADLVSFNKYGTHWHKHTQKIKMTRRGCINPVIEWPTCPLWFLTLLFFHNTLPHGLQRWCTRQVIYLCQSWTNTSSYWLEKSLFVSVTLDYSKETKSNLPFCDKQIFKSNSYSFLQCLKSSYLSELKLLFQECKSCRRNKNKKHQWMFNEIILLSLIHKNIDIICGKCFTRD